jgi:hypothetical protein
MAMLAGHEAGTEDEGELERAAFQSGIALRLG